MLFLLNFSYISFKLLRGEKVPPELARRINAPGFELLVIILPNKHSFPHTVRTISNNCKVKYADHSTFYNFSIVKLDNSYFIQEFIFNYLVSSIVRFSFKKIAA